MAVIPRPPAVEEREQRHEVEEPLLVAGRRRGTRQES